MSNAIQNLHTIPYGDAHLNYNKASNAIVSPNISDTPKIHYNDLSHDPEAKEAMDLVKQGLSESPQDALLLHEGLEYNRVLTLLGMK